MKYLVGMSGGIDSSVVAVKLKKEGHDVIAAHMILWAEDMSKNKCCNTADLMFARRIASRYDIPFYTMDFRQVFKEKIVDNAFLKTVKEGKTPNPCVSCNRDIRFGEFIRKAIDLGMDKVCTGHYAIIEKKNGIYRLKSGIDKIKDQSYFLHRVTQYKLSKMHFPLGDMTKNEVKDLAGKWGLINEKRVKAESQDLCFIPEKTPEPFIKRHLDKVHWKEGDIITSNDQVVGKHRGLPFYTKGQRRGLNIGGLAEPLYVIGKDKVSNKIIVNTHDEGVRHVSLKGFNLIENRIDQKKLFDIKIRYAGKSVKGHVEISGDDESDDSGNLKKAMIIFDKSVIGVTPGQYAVIYDGEYCLGGGEIL